MQLKDMVTLDMIFLDKMNSLVPFIMYENSLGEHLIY